MVIQTHGGRRARSCPAEHPSEDGNEKQRNFGLERNGEAFGKALCTPIGVLAEGRHTGSTWTSRTKRAAAADQLQAGIGCFLQQDDETEHGKAGRCRNPNRGQAHT